MTRIRFGTFLAPHHPVGEHPTLQFQRDLRLVEHLDRLGFDEFWCGEHHSSGWEMIASPELFLAVAAERTKRIRLGTGVVSLPYHHPFNVAQRIVQLDHMTLGRVIFGTGPGALPSDARTFGIDYMLLRDRQDEAIGILKRLFAGERITYKGDWFQLNDAQLQILPYQEDLPMAAASAISPSGMQLAGKYGMGVLSIASTSQEGLQALPIQWSFAEESAKKHDQKVDRKNWRVVMAWHLAESKGQAERSIHVADKWELLARVTGIGNAVGTSVIGTPDEMVKTIRALQEVTGGFGVVLGFAHDWANHEATLRSWDLFARYVIPEINGHTRNLKASAEYLAANKVELMSGLNAAIMAKVQGNKVAEAAMAVTRQRMAAQTRSVGRRPESGTPATDADKGEK